MDDALLAGRAAGGDLDAFGQLYDRTFPRVYDFVWRALRDAGEAAEVTEQVFVRSARDLSALKRAPTFDAALFAMAHQAVISRRAGATAPPQAPAHDEAFGTFDAPDPFRLSDPALVADDHELASLIWEAMTALNPRDYALLDLHLRQGLDAAELAHVINLNKASTQTVLARLESAAGAVVGSYVVARRGGKDCDKLQLLVAGHTMPPYTDEMRRAIDAHVAGCSACQRTRDSLPNTMDVFRAFVPVQAPFVLKGEAWRGIAGSWAPGAATIADQPLTDFGQAGAPPLVTAAAFGGGMGPPPFALPGSDSGWRGRAVLFAAAAAGFLLFAITVGVIFAGILGDDDGGPEAGASDGTRTAGASTPETTPGISLPTATPFTPSATPDVTETPAATPAPPTPPPPPTAPPPPPVTATPPPQQTVPAVPTPTRGSIFGLPTPTPRPGTPTGG